MAIAARTDEDTEQAEVTITDGARPIAAGEVGKVFHIGSPRSHGGVGLTVAKQIVKGHGGSITVKPANGGNLFTIRLPLLELRSGPVARRAPVDRASPMRFEQSRDRRPVPDGPVQVDLADGGVAERRARARSAS